MKLPNSGGQSNGGSTPLGGSTRGGSLLRPLILAEGWLVKSREHGMRFPLLKSKWVRRYFVLRVVSDNGLDKYVLQEYRNENKRRLRKSLDLNRCIQVDSYLQLADTSCRGSAYQWIFSMYFNKKDSEKKVELYLVAESEEEMLNWVSAICRACRLERQDGNEEIAVNKDPVAIAPTPISIQGLRSEPSILSSSVAGISLSSNLSSRSFESVIDTPAEEINVHDGFNSSARNYLHINKFYSQSTPRTPRSKRKASESTRSAQASGRSKPGHRRTGSQSGGDLWNVGDSSASVCSSVSSSRKSISDDDESSSCISSNTSNNRDFGQIQNSQLARSRIIAHYTSGTYAPLSPRRDVPPMSLNQPVPAPPAHFFEENADNESSGETIKLNHLPVATSYVITTKSFSVPQQPSLPPVVDRSKKPARLRPDSDDDRPYELQNIPIQSFSRQNQFARNEQQRGVRPPPLPKTTPKRSYVIPDGPKSAGLPVSSRHLEYFEPVDTRFHSALRRTPVDTSKSTTNIDIDYIKIDPERTQAVKHLIAQRYD